MGLPESIWPDLSVLIAFNKWLERGVVPGLQPDPRTTRTPVSTITTNRFIDLGLSRTLPGWWWWWWEGWENDHKAREKEARGHEGEEDNYVVFPRSIFFWMARAEW